VTELKVPSFLDFANVEPFREDLFEKLLDERDMLYEALHVMVLRFGHHVRNQRELAAMDGARDALTKINKDWQHEHPSG
jgi:hypothetical protein